jgi:hypothetical protein
LLCGWKNEGSAESCHGRKKAESGATPGDPERLVPVFSTRIYECIDGPGDLLRGLEGLAHELMQKDVAIWRAGRDSNPRPSGSKPDALSS